MGFSTWTKDRIISHLITDLPTTSDPLVFHDSSNTIGAWHESVRLAVMFPWQPKLAGAKLPVVRVTLCRYRRNWKSA